MNLAMPRWLRDNNELMQGLSQYCLADMGRVQANAYYRDRAASFRETDASMNDAHKIVRANLAAKYEEIADEVGSSATTIRHPEIVWRNWRDDDGES
jgi:hypothetical protein